MAAPKSSESSAHHFEEIVEQAKTTCDKEYRRHNSAKKTITKVYKHPQGIEFIHMHEDGRDYEDSYRYETVQIGAIKIKYSYDWGNYFVMEDVYLYVNDKQIAPLIESRLTSIIKHQFLLYLHQDNNPHDYFINTRLASRRKELNWVNRGLQN